jgi:hypothetical protein
MGLWRIPEKILLPAEPDGPGTFEFNGRLPNGEQVMAYVGSRTDETYPPTKPIVRHTAVLFRFDADGVLQSCEFATAKHGGDNLEQDGERSYRQARDQLDRLVQKVKAEGWVSANILVRPFYIVVDGLQTGLVYYTEGEDDEDEWEYSPEEVHLEPFGKIFYPPWTDGRYDT